MEITTTFGAQPQPTMTTVRIAELTGKQHKHVLRDTETMLDKLKIDRPKFGRMYQDEYGRQQRCYELPEREVTVLITGYSIELRAKVIDDLKAAKALLRTNVGAVNYDDPGLIAGMIAHQQAKISVLQPKAEAFDLLASTDGLHCLRDMAKEITTGRRFS